MAASCFLTSCDDGESGKSEPVCEGSACDENKDENEQDNTKPEIKPGEVEDCSKDNSCPPGNGTLLCGGKECSDDEECIEDRCEKVERCGDVLCGDDEECIDDKCEKAERCGNVLCGDDEECIEDICQKKSEGVACGDTQCSKDEQCIDDICKPAEDAPVSCMPECSETEECIDGKCYPVVQDACSTIVCNENELCKEGTCQTIAADCGGKVCNDDETCINDNCEKIDESCGSKPKCEDGETCVEDVCTKVSGEDEDDNEDDDDDDGDEPPKVEVAGQIVVSPDSGLKTYRSGETAKFSVVLDVQPGQKISVPIKSLDTTLGTVAPDTLTFTTDKWNTPQIVTVTGTTAATVKNKTYKVEVGPLNTKDEIYKDTPKITLTVTHVDDKTGKGKCTSKQSKDDDGECITKPVTGISMDYNSYALRRGETRTLKVKVTPSNASNKDMTWKLVEADTGKTLNSAGTIIHWTKDGPSITLKGVAKNAHTVKMKVTSKSNKKISTEATILVKPYTRLSYQNAFDFKNFKFSCKNDNEDGYKKGCELGKGDLLCETYNSKSVDVFNKDLYTKYVRPRMMRVKQSNGKYKYYGTRASVVAAARFLTLQFPYDIPYYMEKDRDMRLTQGDYIWISREKRNTAEKARIFGLNLSKKAFGMDADGNYVMLTKKDKNGNYKAADDIISWSCDVKNKFGKKARNGLACSSFVIWALRNGHMHLGAWTSTELAFLLSGDHDGLKNYLSGKNKNNVFDNAYEKLTKIKKSDFIKISKMTGKEDIKAGDLVWHGNDHSSYGHVAMIIGIKRSNGSISEVYVAEATNTKNQHNANHVEHYKSLKALKESKWTKGEIVSYIIKMDSVYDYYSQKKDGKYLKGEDGVELNGNTYQYSDMWSN